MTKEDKQLLLIDICARLPHGLKFRFELSDGSYRTIDLWRDTLINFDQEYCFWILRGDIIPYLRSMSSMTDEEKEELYDRGWLCEGNDIYADGFLDINNVYKYYKKDLQDIKWIIDWLNAHHFDYRGLIHKGLALEAPEGMYKIE